jgi:pimeloyl-ACP methyl ester carboxylesterase
VVASGLGAAFAIRAATRAGGRIARLAAICPAGLGGTLDRGQGSRGAAITALVRSPLIGEAAFNALASRAAIRRFLERRAYGDPAHCTPDVVDHYYAVTHQPGARYVPAAYAGGALDCDVARDLPFLDVPLQVLWGEKAPDLAPRANADEFLRLARDARLVTFERSGLLPHEEEPDAVDAALAAFVTPVTH